MAVALMSVVLQHMPTTPVEVIPLSIESAPYKMPEKQAAPEPRPQQFAQPNPKLAPRVQSDVAQPLAQQTTPGESHSLQPVSKDSVSPSTPTQTPPIASPTVDPALAYNVKLAAAVQAAFEVPGSAKALAFKGRARVEFTLHEGMASAIRVIQGSGLGAVDRAAIKAVESATFPLPPVELKNKVGTYQIWIACF